LIYPPQLGAENKKLYVPNGKTTASLLGESKYRNMMEYRNEIS
jgi:hypothetical protein